MAISLSLYLRSGGQTFGGQKTQPLVVATSTRKRAGTRALSSLTSLRFVTAGERFVTVEVVSESA